MATHPRPRHLLILASCLLALGANADEDSPEAWATYLDLEIADKVLEIYLENEAPTELPAEPISMDRFAKELPEPYRSHLPRRDGWGRPLMVADADEELLIVSAGENGAREIIENFAVLTSDEPYFGDEAELYGDDIYLVVGRGVKNGPRTLASRQKTTMANLRTIGTAVEEFSIDNNFYPVQMNGLQGLQTVEKRVAPVYMRKLPMNDAWGNPMLYWCNGEDYVIFSTGADGVPDDVWLETRPDQVRLPGKTSDPDVDIVFSNGSFVQWPER